MDLLGSMILGFKTSLQPINLLFCFIGVTFGTLVGVLPGLGPIGAMAILLPVTFYAPPLASIIMLAGLMSCAGPLTSMALKFGPPEYFSLMILGLVILIYLTQKSLTKAIIMGC